MTTRITVIVPFYNSEQYIADCIRGLLSQNYPKNSYEIIMVDNNSTDRSAEIVKLYPRITMLTAKKQSSYIARNRGIIEAKSEILAFTDSDCVPGRNWLQQIDKAMRDTDVGVLVGSRQFAKQSVALSLMEAYENERNYYVLNSKFKDLYYGYTNNMAVRKKIFDELGLFVERKRGSDTIFVRRSVERFSCNIVRYCPSMVVRHLEIGSLFTLYQKYYVYAKSRRKYRHLIKVKSLNNSERLQVFHRTILTQGNTPIMSILLVFLLGSGLLFWHLGSISTAAPETKSVAPPESLKGGDTR